MASRIWSAVLVQTNGPGPRSRSLDPGADAAVERFADAVRRATSCCRSMGTSTECRGAGLNGPARASPNGRSPDTADNPGRPVSPNAPHRSARRLRVAGRSLDPDRHRVDSGTGARFTELAIASGMGKTSADAGWGLVVTEHLPGRSARDGPIIECSDLLFRTGCGYAGRSAAEANHAEKTAAAASCDRRRTS
jgi:hypothetical protein